jgi:hypothetical protein
LNSAQLHAKEFTMSNIQLKAAALNLETELKAYADLDAEAAELYADLKPLLKLVKEGLITAPWEWGQIPGRYRFSEQGL